MEKNKMSNLLLLALTSREVLHASKTFLAHLNIDVPSESIKVLLAVYYSNEDVIQQKIADAVRKDKSAVLRQIDNLEKKNLVQRVIDPNDRRRNIIRVTSDGIDLINQINEKLDELFTILSDGLSVSDLNTFDMVLAHFRNKAKTL